MDVQLLLHTLVKVILVAEERLSQCGLKRTWVLVLEHGLVTYSF